MSATLGRGYVDVDGDFTRCAQPSPGGHGARCQPSQWPGSGGAQRQRPGPEWRGARVLAARGASQCNGRVLTERGTSQCNLRVLELSVPAFGNGRVLTERGAARATASFYTPVRRHAAPTARTGGTRCQRPGPESRGTHGRDRSRAVPRPRSGRARCPRPGPESRGATAELWTRGANDAPQTHAVPTVRPGPTRRQGAERAGANQGQRPGPHSARYQP